MRIFGWKWLAILSALTLVAYVIWQFSSRNAYESAEYEVLRSSGEIELRKYPDLMLATTPMSSAAKSNDGSFGRLFGYIAGQNEERQKISMTTPVFMDVDPSESELRMSFVMPRKVVENGVPDPTSGEVQLSRREGGKFAAIRFSGRIRPELVDQKWETLEGWIKSQGLKVIGEVEVAGYDPPWTPGPFRRNEILARVESSDSL